MEPSSGANSDTPSQPTAETAEALDRKFFDLVSSLLDQGVGEDEIADEVRELGMLPKAAWKYVRSVSAYNLTENTRPAVLRRIAELRNERTSPYMIVEAIQNEGLSKAEGNRLLRDIEAMKADIEDERGQVKNAARIATGAFVVLAFGSFLACMGAIVPRSAGGGGVIDGIISCLIGISGVVLGAVLHLRAAHRIEQIEKVICPPGASGESGG
jgi:hypothetical protein